MNTSNELRKNEIENEVKNLRKFCRWQIYRIWKLNLIRLEVKHVELSKIIVNQWSGLNNKQCLIFLFCDSSERRPRPLILKIIWK